MARFVIDENMPRSTAPVLRSAGYDAIDVRDAGLRGADDGRIFAFAQASSATLITADHDFANVLTFRLGTHTGIMIVRIPNQFPNEVVNREILRALNEMREEDLTGSLAIIEIGRTRVRRPPPAP
jgi:predicted nuclease of predicted toxin-antitoxin system